MTRTVPCHIMGEIHNCHINVDTGKELTIREFSQLIVKAVGFEGELAFDASKPDGTMRKLIDVSKLHSLGWTHKVEIEDGVQKLFDWYKASLGVKDADKNKDTAEDVLKSREVGQN